MVTNPVGGYSYVLIVPRKRRGRVWKAKTNNIAFTDVFKYDNEKLEKKNLKVTHHRHLVRQ